VTVHSPALADIRSDTAGIDWPPVSTGPAAVLAALLAQLEDSQWLAPQAIAEHQFRQLVVLARHADRHSTQFHARLERAGLTPEDLVTPQGLARLPPLVRRDIQSAGAGFFCDEMPDGHAPVSENFSSGSTGEPVMIKRTAMNQLDWLAMTMRDHLWWGRDFLWREAAVRAQAPVYAERPDWGSPATLLLPTGPAARIPLATPIAEQVRLLRAFRPGTILLHPNNLGGLTEHCRAQGVAFSGLHNLRTFGETLLPHVREEAEAYFNVKVDDCYSSQEIGYIALQCPESGLYHTMAESVLVEILDEAAEPCAKGEAGHVVVTDLHNFATPIVRYDIGDWAEVGGAGPCGRGLPTLARVLGRQRNLILMPDGTRHWPLSGFQRVRALAPIRQSQFVQVSRERIEVHLAVERPLTSREEDAVRALIEKILGHAFALDFRYFDDRIPSGPGGKFEHFICKAE